MKAPKKRTKKHDPQKAFKFLFNKLINEALDTIYFIGDEFRKPTAFNCHHLRNTALRNSVREAEIEFMTRILNGEFKWRTIIVAFLEGDEEGLIDTVATELSATTTFVPYIKYLEENMLAAVHNAIEKDGCDKDKLLSYAYLVLKNDGKFERYSEKLTDMMFEIDLLALSRNPDKERYNFTCKDFVESMVNYNYPSTCIDNDDDFVEIKRSSDYVPVEV